MVEEENQDQPTFSELLLTLGQQRIALRTARKIAKRLSIRQKVNGKDQPRDWIVAQIEKRYNKDRATVIPILEEIYGQTATSLQSSVA